MVTLSLICGAASGRLESVSSAALQGASDAVELCFAMAGTLCLWNGVMEIWKQSGLSESISYLLRPVLKKLFPEAGRDVQTLAAISANVSANLLGLGNAATPFGIQAVRRMAHGSRTASDELCRFVVLNTASVQLFPATVASIRAAAGCQTPFDILPAVWISSGLSVTAGLLAERIFAQLGKESVRTAGKTSVTAGKYQQQIEKR